MKKFLSLLPRILLCLIAEFLLFWFQLPPINLRSPDFWSFIFESIAICSLIIGMAAIVSYVRRAKGRTPNLIADGKAAIKNAALPVKIIIGVLVAIILFSLVMNLIGTKLFNASGYSKMLTPETGDFSADVSEISMSQIPVVDTATRLGQRKLGEMSDLVSQFEIESDYTQINFKDRPTRVTPLMYADIVKWFTNKDEGIPAYISVDLTTQDTELVRLSDLGLDNIKYSRSEYFMRDVDRYLRFKYPTKIFGEVSFEVDDNGTPYWVASVISYKIGFWDGQDTVGAVILNAVSGESRYYDLKEIPKWVDQIFDAEMIIEQLTYNGLYSGGYWNSVFGQVGCKQPTEGYNYIAIDDDVWLYTGITSVTADESNVGFVLINLRTKEAKYYVQAGAEEYSAMDSAEGQVQHLGYDATFPLLLNIGDRPTYFMSLKDDAGLVKMYAFVDMAQYQVVGTGSSVDKAREAYIEALKDEDISPAPTPGGDCEESVQKTTVSGKISAVTSVVIDGNTCYYLMLEGVEGVKVVPATATDLLPFATLGDQIKLEYENGELVSAEVIFEGDQTASEENTASDTEKAE